MFCKKCGTENDNGAKFCKSCGAPLDSNGENPRVDASSPSSENQNKSPLSANAAISNLAEKSKKLSKKALIGICGAVVAIIAIIVIASNADKTINLNDYVTVEATGYDGYGTASVSIDWDAIEKKYGKKIAYTSASKKTLGDFSSLMTPLDTLEASVSVQLDQDRNLSNGDTINYSWSVVDDISKVIKCKLKYKDGTYTVSELEKLDTFDAFADVEVTFSGISPNGQAAITYNGSDLNSYDFQCDKTSGLKNDDIITVSLSNTDMEHYATSLGKIPAVTSMEYTVSGLQEYVTSYADITDTFIENTKKEAEDTIYSYAASHFSKTSALNNLEYAGYIYNCLKDDRGLNSVHNALYLIYKGDESNSEGAFSTTKVYFPVQFANILKAGDDCSFTNNNGIKGHSPLDSVWYSTDGYTNPLTCYTEIVESNRDDYTSECGDGFEIYAEHENIEKLDDIAETYKETLYAEIKDTIESYISKKYPDGSAVDELSFKGEYLLKSKAEGNDFSNSNKYIIVYSAVVSNSEGKFDTATVYFPVEYDGVVKLPGDEYMTTKRVGILGSTSLPNSWINTAGYLDGTRMYSDIITSNRDKYTYEVSDGLKEFGE